ncbi:hypothetical protein [Enterocloster clostridioformis]|uniref:hypothetical protein n=1 Tax=Enterocloster clostridioformis TaxID=1531 RepID=UPI002FE6F2F6
MTIGKGTVVMTGVVINPGVRIGKGCIINTCVFVDHNCVLGDFRSCISWRTCCGYGKHRR